MTTKATDALTKMREPFAANHISKLPKPTKAQTEALKADFKKGIRCKQCEGWHHPDVIHLDYVGHAALTDRMLDADINWTWEPVAFTETGLPAFDQHGGLWIRLTIGGHTRLGYGHAASKPNADPGSREKEVIGDALRNAAMRFGAALDLWHKGNLHADEEGEGTVTPIKQDTKPDPTFISEDQRIELVGMFEALSVNVQDFCEFAGIKTLSMLSAARFNDARAKITEMSRERQAA